MGKEEKKRNYKVYSDKLDKLFNTVEELEEAEKAFDEEEAKKLAAVDEKKAMATKVEDSYKEYLNAVKEASKKIEEANKECSEKIKAACKLSDDARKAYETALNEFLQKYKAFHSTIKLEDGSEKTISIETEPKNIYFNDIFGDILKTFWRF